jgi:ABC-type transporter Mla MlaB component
MGKEADTKPGLLGKVAKFIKNPTTDWADIDRDDPPNSRLAFDNTSSRLALKEIIKRKHRDDLVRKREFDMLRKIRHKGQGQNDGIQTIELISSYSSSLMARDAEKWDGVQKRERTLRQIDEIEAQLSRSWFRSRSGDDSVAPMRLRPAPIPPKLTASPAWPAARDMSMAPPATATAREQDLPSHPSTGFAPAVLPVGAGILGQPRPPDRLARASAYNPRPPDLEFKPVPALEQPIPPMLTQTYQPEAGRIRAQAPVLPSRSPEGLNPSPQWRSEAAPDNSAVQREPATFGLRESAVPSSQPNPVIGATAAARPHETRPPLPPRQSQPIQAPSATRVTVPISPSVPPAQPALQPERSAPVRGGATIDAHLPAQSGAGNSMGPSPVPKKENPASAPSPKPLKPDQRRRASVYENALENNIEVVALRQGAEIEEAAISFANGDEMAAELMLLKLVSTGSSQRTDVDIWLALFDLYRVTGKSDAFDGLVPEFTALFGRSAPQWEGASDQVPASRQDLAPQAAANGAFTWVAPAQFNARALAALTGAVKRSAQPWRFDWRSVKSVEPDVLPQINELFKQWADTPVQLQLLGSEQLLATLTRQSSTGNKTANPAWWYVRLALLRLIGAPDLFDQTALDYCITYEISPPAWTSPKCACTLLTADGQPESAPAEDAVSVPRTFAPTTIIDELLTATSASVFEAALEGEILGSAAQVLAVLPKNLERIQAFDFNCRALRRVDFGAAGELLNWSISQQGEGRTVTFHNVHRLLATFLSVIGVDAIAQVVLRKDLNAQAEPPWYPIFFDRRIVSPAALVPRRIATI